MTHHQSQDDAPPTAAMDTLVARLDALLVTLGARPIQEAATDPPVAATAGLALRGMEGPLRPEAVDELFAEEQRAIARAVPRRRSEYATVRVLARRLFASFGVPPAPLTREERGAPRWPSGLCGSLTHCTDRAAAVVASATYVRSLGIDLEPHGRLPEHVADRITVPAEAAWLAAVAEEARAGGLHLDRLLFCAKEATYKAWWPLTRRWLDFSEAHIRIFPDALPAVPSVDLLTGTVRSTLCPTGGVPEGIPTELHGCFVADAHHVRAALLVPAC